MLLLVESATVASQCVGAADATGVAATQVKIAALCRPRHIKKHLCRPHHINISNKVHCGQAWTVLEKTQRFALRLIQNDHQSSYEVLLEQLELSPISRVYMCYSMRLCLKYVRSLRYLPLRNELIVPSQPTHNHNLRARTSNSSPLCDPFPRGCLNIIRDLPIYRVIENWKLLSDDLIGMSLYSFKTAVSAGASLFDSFCDFV